MGAPGGSRGEWMLAALSLSLGRRFIATVLQVSYWFTKYWTLTYYHCRLMLLVKLGVLLPNYNLGDKKEIVVHPICFFFGKYIW